MILVQLCLIGRFRVSFECLLPLLLPPIPLHALLRADADAVAAGNGQVMTHFVTGFVDAER